MTPLRTASPPTAIAPGRAGPAHRPAWAVWPLLAALSACVSQGSSQRSAPADYQPDPRTENRSASEPIDKDRRAQVRLELAALYFGRGQNETALSEVNLAIAARPDLSDGYNLRGLIYGNMAESRLAEESFQRALQLKPQAGDAMHNYGWFLCQQRRFAQADQLFVQALALPQYRDQVRSLLAQGVCQARAGRTADAERTLLRSYEADPANPATAVSLSEVLYRSGDYERARFYIRRVNNAPERSNAQTLWLAARIEHKLTNPGGVEAFARELRARFPQSPETLAFEQGRFDE